jgi:L-amino acid N-acyltransferase YncA
MTRCIHVLGTLAIILLVFSKDVRAGDVPYLSGGVGADAREELLAKEKEYNLKIVGAEKSGDYLAGVKVVIESARKEQVLDTTMEGPILLAKLAPGTYTIRAVNDGQTLTRTVTVPAQGLGRVDLRWSMTK